MNNGGCAARRTVIVACLIVFGIWEIVFAEDFGTTYQQYCAACHNIGGGRLVGPDLAGITERRSEDWLIKWIKSSQAMVNSGDPVAKALVDEYKIVMPDQALTEEQIKGVLAYIKGKGGATTTGAEAPATATVAEGTPEEILLGQNLFQGKIRFSNGGPSCIACHNVENESVYGGGILAKELTTVFSRMGGAGVRAIVSSPPFPVMKAAFENKPVTEAEVSALVAFLQFTDKENTLHQPREYGWAMFGAGSVGVIALLGFYSLIGRRRKRNSVNQEIYDRQVKSE